MVFPVPFTPDHFTLKQVSRGNCLDTYYQKPSFSFDQIYFEGKLGQKQTGI